MSVKEDFQKRWNCEVEEQSDLAAIKEAKADGKLNDIKNAIGKVQGNHDRTEIVESRLWIYKVTWNNNVEKVQISCYTYSAGITWEGDSEDE